MSSELVPGSVLAGYRIDRVIGRGGMGVVYEAQHLHLERGVALKVIAPELAQDPQFAERFVREARLAASLDHPNIVPIHDAGEHGGVLFVVMRFVRGSDLGGLIAQHGALDLVRTLALLEQVAGALDTAHRNGLVHRDVKPGNVLVEPTEAGERAYLTDFGLTKRMDTPSVTASGTFVGTVDYAAPEQLQGEDLDGRTDVYALACVLYHCLVGAPPFERPTMPMVAMAHIAEPPPRLAARRPDLPAALDEVLQRGMAKNREMRYSTCSALVDAARQAVGDQRGRTVVAPLPYAPAPPAAPGGKGQRRNRAAIVLGAIAALLAVGIGAAVLLLGGDDGGGAVGPTTPVSLPATTPSAAPTTVPPTSEPPSSAPPTASSGPVQVAIVGTLTRVFDEPNPLGLGAARTGGCDDLAGLPVTVTDGSGNQVGTSATGDAVDGDAQGDNETGACSVEFAVEGPEAVQYEVSVADVVTERFTTPQLEAVLFRPTLEVAEAGVPPFGPGDVEEVRRVASQEAESFGPVESVDRPTFDVATDAFDCESGQLAFVLVQFTDPAQVAAQAAQEGLEGLMILCRLESGGIPVGWEVTDGPLFGE